MASSNSNPQKSLLTLPLKRSANQSNPAGSAKKLPHLLSDDATPGSTPNRKTHIPGKKVAFSDSPADKSKTKICIRIKKIKPPQQPAQHIDPAAIVVNEHQDQPQAKDLDQPEESIAKAWKLRPKRRRLVKGPRPSNKLSVAIADQPPNLPQSSCPKATNDALLTERTEKQKKPSKTNFSIPLTKLEIEEDILAITGSKPSRKPGKRARHVQKQLDQLFPGMWLSSVTPDLYKVHDSPAKIR